MPRTSERSTTSNRLATDDEVRASALQYVRKISGFTKPSRANEEAFERAVDAVAAISTELLAQLQTNAPPKNREAEAAKARARAAQRYAGESPRPYVQGAPDHAPSDRATRASRNTKGAVDAGALRATSGCLEPQ